VPVLISDKTACAATVYAAAIRTRLVAFGGVCIPLLCRFVGHCSSMYMEKHHANIEEDVVRSNGSIVSSWLLMFDNFDAGVTTEARIHGSDVKVAVCWQTSRRFLPVDARRHRNHVLWIEHLSETYPQT